MFIMVPAKPRIHRRRRPVCRSSGGRCFRILSCRTIQKALAHNYDLQLATERIISARAQLKVTRSDQFLQVTANVDGTNGSFSKAGFRHDRKTAPCSRRDISVDLFED
jgi:hypothetical protein